jgi:Putative auto-transporter adhesin, head GIN domain
MKTNVFYLKPLTMNTVKITLTLVLLSALAGSCYFDNLDTISGNGKVVKQNRAVSGFSGLKVATGIDAVITQGDNESLVVEADTNLLDYIKTDVIDGKLKIYSDKNIRHAKAKKVYIEYKKLNSIDISSAGNVQGNNTLVTDALDVEMSSAGDLALAVEADKLEISISSAGDAKLSGKVNSLKADLSSAGDLKAFELEAKIGDISVSSAGSASVFITDEASFECSSAGNINYKGEPRLKNVRTSSAGSVNKK